MQTRIAKKTMHLVNLGTRFENVLNNAEKVYRLVSDFNVCNILFKS